jgi:Immunoglobulin I-set domain/HYR domain
VPNVMSGVSVSDNCSAPIGISLSQSPAAGTMVGVGTHTITVTATDAAGNSASCTTTFTVETSISASGPGDLEICQGQDANFATVANGVGSFEYQWRLDGNAVGTNGATLTQSTTELSPGDHLVQVEVRGQCGLATTNVATLTVLVPTMATAPADLMLKPGESARFSTSASGTEPLAYQWRKDGVDIAGATSATYRIASVSGTDAGVYCVVVSGACGSVTNCAALAVDECTPLASETPHLNRQTGLFEQKASFTNSTDSAFSAVRVWIRGLPEGVQVYNASGEEDGVPFVQYNESLASGEVIYWTIEYYVPTRRTPESTLCAKPVPSSSPANQDGAPVTIDRTVRLPDGTFLIEFASVPGQVYVIQYCDDFVNWKTVIPSVTNGANRTQWIDNGPPKTDRLPSERPSRFYRVITSR